MKNTNKNTIKASKPIKNPIEELSLYHEGHKDGYHLGYVDGQKQVLKKIRESVRVLSGVFDFRLLEASALIDFTKTPSNSDSMFRE